MKIKKVVWNWLKIKFHLRSKDLLIAKYRRKIGKILFRKKYNSRQLIEHLKSLGLVNGSVVLLHSSWDEFYNYQGSIQNFIDSLIDFIGPTGTILMPAYPLLRNKSSIFDLSRTPTIASLIAEEFRKYPGVKRSTNIHSVCALGPLSDFLLSEHHLSKTSWDEKSPYFKLCSVNGIVLTIGVGKYFVGTTMHCADSILRSELQYFGQFFTKNIIYKFRLIDGSIFEQHCLTSDDNFHYEFTNRSHRKFINKYLNKKYYKRTMFSNLSINYYDANHLINTTIKMGRLGKTVYTKPKWKN